MKRCILFSLISLLLALLLPTALWYAALPEPDSRELPGDEPPQPTQPPQAPAEPIRRTDDDITLTLLRDGVVTEMTMAQYLPGVVAGEMPASFETEALRAQAVAGRTFALRRRLEGSPQHPEADLCDDPGCCQAWLDEPAMKEFWGKDHDAMLSRILAAAEDTDGTVLLYEGQPILACFHASSAGKTENCAAVWGAPVPYLVSVDSPETAADVPNFVTTVELTPEEFRRLASEAIPNADFTGEPADWAGEHITDPSGRVAMIRLGGQAVSGTQVRAMFGLRSAAFRLEWTGHTFLFTVTGSGHGAGMSQYGANVMARQGQDYRQILLHYYPGAELSVNPEVG